MHLLKCKKLKKTQNQKNPKTPQKTGHTHYWQEYGATKIHTHCGWVCATTVTVANSWAVSHHFTISLGRIYSTEVKVHVITET